MWFAVVGGGEVRRDRPEPSAGLAARAEPGPDPLVRALVGLLLGVAAGAVAALVTPRPQRARRPAVPAG